MTFNHNNLPQRVVLIDTPGFDDINRNDSDVLQDITFILSQTYEQGMKLTGIIYLHRITDVRMSGSALKNLAIFKKLCRENFYDPVVLATTIWGNLVANRNDIIRGIAREKELIETKNWWGLMCNRGSKVFRYNGDRKSAVSIILYLIALGSAATLDFQREMIHEKNDLADTSVRQKIQKELQEQQRKHEKERLELTQEKALKDKDHELAEELLKERQESNKKFLSMERAQQELLLDFQQLKADRETHHGQMLKLHEKRLKAKFSEDKDRWEQKSREDKRALEELAYKLQEEKQRRENESLESRRAMAAMDKQSRQEKQRLEQVIAQSQRAQMIWNSERNSEVMRLQGMLEKQQAESNSKVTKLQEKLEELQSASKKASDVARIFGWGGIGPSTLRFTSLSLGRERSVVFIGSPPGSRDLHGHPPEGADNDGSPFYGPRYDGYDKENGRYHHHERHAYAYNRGESEYVYDDGSTESSFSYDGNKNYHYNNDRGDHYDGGDNGDYYDDDITIMMMTMETIMTEVTMETTMMMVTMEITMMVVTMEITMMVVMMETTTMMIKFNEQTAHLMAGLKEYPSLRRLNLW